MKSLNVVGLGGLRALEAVGRLGTLRAAADELGVTVGAVSQKIQKAEAQLGRQLFDRSGRGLKPTPHGERVLGHLSTAMAELARAVKLARFPPEDVLTVSVAPVFAEKWLVWRLKGFTDAHPGVRVRVEANLELVDPDSSDVDLCIRVGPRPPAEIRATKLVDHRIFPVCSPDLARDIHTPKDLAGLPIIRDAGEMFGWEHWLAPHGLDASILGDGPVFNSGSMCLDAAIAGQGVFLAWETLAGHSLEAGRLIAPFRERVQTDLAYWLITGRYRPESNAVKRFGVWLREELANSIEID